MRYVLLAIGLVWISVGVLGILYTEELRLITKKLCDRFPFLAGDRNANPFDNLDSPVAFGWTNRAGAAVAIIGGLLLISASFFGSPK